jgi:hypothetical protein
LETGNPWLGRYGFHVSREFVDAGETLGGVVTFECHVGPCLSRERASIGPSVAARLFNVEQSAFRILRLVLVMAMVDEETVKQLLMRGAVPMPQALNLALQMPKRSSTPTHGAFFIEIANPPT